MYSSRLGVNPFNDYADAYNSEDMDDLVIFKKHSSIKGKVCLTIRETARQGNQSENKFSAVLAARATVNRLG